MVNILARTKDSELLTNVSLERLSYKDITWFWVDFESPDEEEIALLSEYFKFADLSIEDCLENLERPKVDYFDTYNFFVFHALNETTLEPIEVDLFVGDNYLISFCKSKLQEISSVRQKIINNTNIKKEGSTYITYLILDKIVDYYFPTIYRIEDSLNEIDDLVNITLHISLELFVAFELG